MIHKAEFLKSSSDIKQCPPENMPEYAFIGRSNVGKSSLINMLTGRKSLAKISSTPGKTQLINHFTIDDKWFLVDLPGYGYAKISKSERDKWSILINNYIQNRENLMNLFVLIDSRIPPQKIDMEFINGLGQNGLPFSIVFTKTDKLSTSKIDTNIQTIKNEILKTWETLPKCFNSSAETGAGREEILKYIKETNKIFDYR